MQDDPIVQETRIRDSWGSREIDLVRDADWYRLVIVLAITVQAALFVSFGIASITAFFQNNMLLAILLALFAVMLKPAGK